MDARFRNGGDADISKVLHDDAHRAAWSGRSSDASGEFSTIEDEIIDPSWLSDDAKSALWLDAWSCVDSRAQ